MCIVNSVEPAARCRRSPLRGGHGGSGQWDDQDLRDWQAYKSDHGMSTVGNAATHAGEAYQNGYEWAGDILK
ncbi:hypothetical protein GCM10010168_77360 [Actinoplanes ianthinogenes]|uniref:Uncharacterized protein n=1 Tax=Actinoplanes ianthinogenes TaxID=122358 RepID=A0ABN6CSU7_9ACTN|nr:hypothetical protein Aiant_89950 [Actinoplanes ianthinogenes]GGR47048.1 hypothetical protein GCM10010168_77360 [Actinoplanes ianthinogenes]